MLKPTEMSFEKGGICNECWMYKAHCCDRTACNPVRQQLRNYTGIRFTSDGFDCALPVSIDSHSVCSFGCLYCFSDNLVQHRNNASRAVGQASLDYLESIFSGKPGKSYEEIRFGLKYHSKKNGYPCPVQLGAITDPLDNIERNQGWFLKFAEIVKKYNQPVRISTKGNLFLTNRYLNAVADRPELFWVAFSIISPDDDLMLKLDKRAPPPSERIESMRRLSEVGVKTSLRFRPILPGFSDSTPSYPKAYKTLVDMAADAGAKAISYEVGFLPGSPTKDLKLRWEEIEKLSGRPLKKIYSSFGATQSCTRPSAKWTEQIMHSIRDVAKARGLTIGVSDPAWKQLGETGCCCGILPDDPVFGNWQKESTTNRLLEAKEGRNNGLITLKDITPEWAYTKKLAGMVNPGVGPKVAFEHRHSTWAGKLKDTWNDLKKERGPLIYFQGALVPYQLDENGDMVYKYKGLERSNLKKTPFWDIKE